LFNKVIIHYKSLIIQPATTTHEQLSADEQLLAGVEPGLLRLSAGLEHVEEIKGDLSLAFEALRAWKDATLSDTILS
jgi:O-acetylhomoserine/O-acetylserine sulfhydrylase-like pyridoxal-dependent enzyme